MLPELRNPSDTKLGGPQDDKLGASQWAKENESLRTSGRIENFCYSEARWQQGRPGVCVACCSVGTARLSFPTMLILRRAWRFSEHCVSRGASRTWRGTIGR